MTKLLFLLFLIFNSAVFAKVEIKIKRKIISPRLFEKINEGQNLNVWKRIALFKKSSQDFEKYQSLVKAELKKTERQTIKNILLTEIYQQKAKELNRSFFRLDKLKFDADFNEFEASLIKSWIKKGLSSRQSREEFIKALIKKGYPQKNDQPLIEAYFELLGKIKKRKIEDYRRQEIRRFENSMFKADSIDLVSEKLQKIYFFKDLISSYSNRWLRPEDIRYLKKESPGLFKLLKKKEHKNVYDLPIRDIREKRLQKTIIAELKSELIKRKSLILRLSNENPSKLKNKLRRLNTMPKSGATQLLKTIYQYVLSKDPNSVEQEIENIMMDIMMTLTFSNGESSPKNLLNNYSINSEIQKVLLLFLQQKIKKTQNKLIKLSFKSPYSTEGQKIITKIVGKEKFIKNKKSFIYNEVRRNYIYWRTLIGTRSLSRHSYLFLMTN